MIRFLKEHPWRSGVFAMLLALAALALVLYLRPRGEPTEIADEHAAHGATPLVPVDEHAEHQGSASTRPAGFAPVALDPAQA